MSDSIEKLGMGWLPDYPDYRDYTIDHKDIKPIVKKVGVTNPSKVSIPESKNLRTWCSPIENQLYSANDIKFESDCINLLFRY